MNIFESLRDAAYSQIFFFWLASSGRLSNHLSMSTNEDVLRSIIASSHLMYEVSTAHEAAVCKLKEISADSLVAAEGDAVDAALFIPAELDGLLSWSQLRYATRDLFDALHGDLLLVKSYNDSQELRDAFHLVLFSFGLELPKARVGPPATIAMVEVP